MQYLFEKHHYLPNVVWALPYGTKVVLSALCENELGGR